METQTKTFDVIIIGSGPGGYLPAILSAQRGLSAAVIEKNDLGGTCLNRGCIPTKTLLHEASLWEAFDRSGLIKNREDRVSYFRKSMEKKDTAIQQVVSGLRNLLNRDRITVIHGEAVFLAPNLIGVNKGGTIVEKLGADRILIASGAVPKEIGPLKRDGQWVIGSDEALQMMELPSAIAIVGGGRRGVEFATLFHAFGVTVTLVEKENRILPKMDREISTRCKGLLARRKVKVWTDAKVISIEFIDKQKSLDLTVEQKGNKERVQCQKVLVVGERRGNLDNLEIERASLSLKDGFIPVDSHMKTSTPGIYAAGDVVGNGFYAHRAFHEGKVAVENMFGEKSRVDSRMIPSCLYAHPEAASIGLTEEEATREYGEVNVGKFPLMACGRSIATGNQEGMVKIISEKKYGEVLGVHMFGPLATELIHLGAMAMRHEIGVDEIKEMIFAHPTFSESFFEAALDTYGEAIHMMKG